jgi:hypothetical protein
MDLLRGAQRQSTKRFMSKKVFIATDEAFPKFARLHDAAKVFSKLAKPPAMQR